MNITINNNSKFCSKVTQRSHWHKEYERCKSFYKSWGCYTSGQIFNLQQVLYWLLVYTIQWNYKQRLHYPHVYVYVYNYINLKKKQDVHLLYRWPFNYLITSGIHKNYVIINNKEKYIHKYIIIITIQNSGNH